MDVIFWFIPVASVIAIATAIFLTLKILKESEGTPRMVEIAQAVREGASAYLNRQYKASGLFFLVLFVVLLIMATLGYLNFFVPFAFLTGGFFSGFSGFCGMKIATLSGSRTANACRTSLNKGLQLAFSSGAVLGFTVVGLGLFDLSVWYLILDWYYQNYPLPEGQDQFTAITATMLTFGMGASFQALFARVGGGIFTKAADVGADLVGKIEAGIPEDDPRNPAVIADNVGDNVGDVAGMGADLYESYVGSIVATAALGVAAGLGFKGLILPMLLASSGILASIMGMTLVKTDEQADQKALLLALRKGIIGSSILIILAAFVLVSVLLGPGFIGIAWAIIIGLAAGVLIGLSTEYYTSAEYNPTKRLAESAQTGSATLVISGIALGMSSTLMPMLIVVAGMIGSFTAAGGFDSFGRGLYGIGIAAVGMLSTLGLTLATDAYGPVADNAGGNAEMAGLDNVVRERTDALDSLGNTTAATGKGFAIGSAALTALALIAAYQEKVELEGGALMLDLMDPLVLIGVFVGAMMPYVFSALTMNAVGEAGSQVVQEVRRQFRDIKGIMENKAKPDYARCVDIVTKSALEQMRAPAIMALLTPLIIGIFFGVNSVGGLLIGSTASGFVLAVMMANSGGAWDNAKKYIEAGHLGGKGSTAHKAGVVGDTVGDPFKDTSGPSINILIKLMSMVSIVFAAYFVQNAVFAG